MSVSKDYNSEKDEAIGAQSEKGQGSLVDSQKEQATVLEARSGSFRSKSSSRRRSSKRESSSSNNSGSSKTKIRNRIKSLKKLFFLGIYAVLMFVTVSKMMDEKLIPSFWMDLAAFGLLWIYYVLTSQKIVTFFRVSKSWFFAHAMVIFAHLAVAIFIGEVDADAFAPEPIHEKMETAPVKKPYTVGEE